MGFPAYEVEIIDTTTGERRTAQIGVEWHDASVFWWTEGNMSCDCNRGMDFDSAGGHERGEHPCTFGPKRFRVPLARLPDGSEIEIDGEP